MTVHFLFSYRSHRTSQEAGFRSYPIMTVHFYFPIGPKGPHKKLDSEPILSWLHFYFPIGPKGPHKKLDSEPILSWLHFYFPIGPKGPHKKLDSEPILSWLHFYFPIGPKGPHKKLDSDAILSSMPDYPCDQCAKSFRRKAALIRHMEFDHKGGQSTEGQEKIVEVEEDDEDEGAMEADHKDKDYKPSEFFNLIIVQSLPLCYYISSLLDTYNSPPLYCLICWEKVVEYST